MKKFNLVAMSYDRDTLLNALQKTGAVEVKLHGEEAYTTVPAEDAEALREYVGRMESALALLSAATEEYNAQNGIKSGLLKDGFEVSYSDFMSAGSRRAETDAVAARIETLAAQKSELSAQLSAVERAIREAAVYAALDIPFSSFSDTAHVCIRLGTIPASGKKDLEQAFSEIPPADFRVLAEGENCVLSVFYHKCVAQEAEAALSAAGFAPCPFSGGETGAERLAALSEQKRKIRHDIQANEYAMYEMSDRIRPLKVYCDYLGYQLEKADLAGKLRVTERTFLLEAYVPAGGKCRAGGGGIRDGSRVFRVFRPRSRRNAAHFDGQ